VALSVRDIDKSADWYARLLELTLVAEFQHHVAFSVTDVAELEAWLALFRRNGATRRGPRLWSR
jgi:catechol 2,3-dioxygenase-like lactoylglutathione lyase family enzyme